MGTMRAFLLMAVLLLNSIGLHANGVCSKVSEMIAHSDPIPGLNAEEFSTLKSEISKTWDSLVENGVIEVSGTDQDVRPSFVALQGIIEQVLASELGKEIHSLKGIIHTPMPATPLCSNGEISPELVDPSIANDPARVFTVKARTTILRDYLFKGGNLSIAYPKEGLKNRTVGQQEIYRQELLNYPDHLFDCPLNYEQIPNHLVGATYLFQDQTDNFFVFGIKMTQAKNPQDQGDFGLWFGSLDNDSVLKRLEEITNYLEAGWASPY